MNLVIVNTMNQILFIVGLCGLISLAMAARPMDIEDDDNQVKICSKLDGDGRAKCLVARKRPGSDDNAAGGQGNKGAIVIFDREQGQEKATDRMVVVFRDVRISGQAAAGGQNLFTGGVLNTLTVQTVDRSWPGPDESDLETKCVQLEWNLGEAKIRHLCCLFDGNGTITVEGEDIAVLRGNLKCNIEFDDVTGLQQQDKFLNIKMLVLSKTEDTAAVPEDSECLQEDGSKCLKNKRFDLPEGNEVIFPTSCQREIAAGTAESVDLQIEATNNGRRPGFRVSIPLPGTNSDPSVAKIVCDPIYLPGGGDQSAAPVMSPIVVLVAMAALFTLIH